MENPQDVNMLSEPEDDILQNLFSVDTSQDLSDDDILQDLFEDDTILPEYNRNTKIHYILNVN